MRDRTVIAAAFAFALAGVGIARGEVLPQPSGGDPRIRVAPYQPDEVVLLTGTMGYEIAVEFGLGERIENVSIGNSLGWQVTPNRKANRLFLKPIDRAAPTDMTVVTNLRVYTLELRVRAAPRRPDDNIIFGLKFDYPEPVAVVATPLPPPPPPLPPQDLNHAYSLKGAPSATPARIFDDGRFTYFAFAANAEYPAIFALDDHGRETVVNISQRDGFVVVDQLAPGFVLRSGKSITRVINHGYRIADPEVVARQSRGPTQDNRP